MSHADICYDDRPHPDATWRGSRGWTTCSSASPPCKRSPAPDLILRRHPAQHAVVGRVRMDSGDQLHRRGRPQSALRRRCRSRLPIHWAGQHLGTGLLALFGAGLVIGGIFTADPALGFPPGAPAGYPERLSVHGMIHAFAPPLAFPLHHRGLPDHRPPVCCRGLRRAAVLTRVYRGCVFRAHGIPVGPGFGVRLFLAVALAFAWIAGTRGVPPAARGPTSRKGYGELPQRCRGGSRVHAVLQKFRYGPESSGSRPAAATRSSSRSGASRWR